MPPDAPGADETLTADEADPVVVACAVNDEKIRERVGATLKKVVITRSERWGTVYRSDTAVPSSPNGPTSLWRTVCWKEGSLVRPLEMNAAGESISPL
jgi:hypothetical protein